MPAKHESILYTSTIHTAYILKHAQTKNTHPVNQLDNIDCFNNMCVSGYSYDELKKYQIQYIKWLIAEVCARVRFVCMCVCSHVPTIVHV